MWIGNIDHEEDGIEVSAKLRDVVLEKNGRDYEDRPDHK